MKMLLTLCSSLFLLIVLCPNLVPAQTGLPEHGTIAEIQGKTKFYLQSPAKERKQILSELERKSGLVEVPRAEDADFIVEYTILNNKEKEDLPGLAITSTTGQMDVYYFRGGRKVLVWSEGKTASWSTAPYLALPRKFVKDLLHNK